MTKTIHSKAQRQLLDLLVEKRETAGITQQDLARRLGNKHQSFVSKYESGERRLDVIEFLKICRVLSLKPESIIKEIAKQI